MVHRDVLVLEAAPELMWELEQYGRVQVYPVGLVLVQVQVGCAELVQEQEI